MSTHWSNFVNNTNVRYADSISLVRGMLALLENSVILQQNKLSSPVFLAKI